MTAPNPRTDARIKAAARAISEFPMTQPLLQAQAALAASDAVSAPLLERVTQSLRALLPHAGVGFMAMGDNEHREYVKARADARAVLAEVDALEAHDDA